MILFLNFAPIEFMGGAEKLILEYAHEVNKKEEARIIDVSSKIANIYGRLILKRSYSSHLKDHPLKLFNHSSLTYLSFIPLTKEWKNTVKNFREARIIYMRFEILETAICFYFGGIKALNKTIAGMHLTPLYSSPRGIVDKLHNFIYGSFVYKSLLKSVKKIHVLNARDKKLLESKYKVTTCQMLPPGIDFKNGKISSSQDKKILNIIFVGELSTRKGVDTLCQIIDKSPSHFSYHIIGDGPLKNAIQKLEVDNKCIYYGYVSDKKLDELYNQSDVLLFPSRAEAFGIVMAEAIGHGARLVNSSEVTLDLPTYIETTIYKRDPQRFIKGLGRIFEQKQNNTIDRSKIRKFAIDNYSLEIINKKFSKEIIGL